jgi:hypothetical protein
VFIPGWSVDLTRSWEARGGDWVIELVDRVWVRVITAIEFVDGAGVDVGEVRLTREEDVDTEVRDMTSAVLGTEVAELQFSNCARGQIQAVTHLVATATELVGPTSTVSDGTELLTPETDIGELNAWYLVVAEEKACGKTGLSDPVPGWGGERQSPGTAGQPL